MTRTNKPTLISNKKQNLKRNKRDPDTDSEEESWDTEYETSESEVSEVVTKKTNKNRIVTSDSESDSDSDYSENDEDDLDPREYKKFLAKLFPSKYISKKIEELSEESIRNKLDVLKKVQRMMLLTHPESETCSLILKQAFKISKEFL